MPSFLGVYNRHIMILLLIVNVGIVLLEAFKRTIGIRIWGFSLVTLCTIVVALIWYDVVRQIPEGVGASDERTISFQLSYEKACEGVIRAIESCRWKLIESDLAQGHFKANAGRTINTFYGQVFTVEVKKGDALSCTLHLRCEALHQLLDYGQNNKKFEQFISQLQKHCNFTLLSNAVADEK